MGSGEWVINASFQCLTKDIGNMHEAVQRGRAIGLTLDWFADPGRGAGCGAITVRYVPRGSGAAVQAHPSGGEVGATSHQASRATQVQRALAERSVRSGFVSSQPRQ